MKTSVKTSLLCVVFCIVAIGLGCEKKPAEPVKSPPPAATPPPAAGNDMKGLADFIDKDKSKSGSTSSAGMNAPTGSLPPGHPAIGGAPSTPQAADSSLPPGHPAIGSTPPMMGQGDGDVTPLKFDAPPQWTSQTPSSAMRKAQFLLPRASGDGEDGQMIVFQFGKGQGGAVEMNIDRWIGMFSTPDGKPVDKDAVKRETHDVGGLKVTTIDITGRFTDAMMGVSTGAAKTNYRMLSAIVETPDGPWFFKGVGPEATMKSHHDEFVKMMGTVKR